MNKRGKITALIGGQYGSEGKGVIASHIANEYDIIVRVGSPNAGHTFYWKGEKHVMQSIPCGWTNPNAVVVIGRGALINMKLLMQEIEHIKKYYPNFLKRLVIDAEAGILSEEFHEAEGGVNGEMHKRIGSTGEGVGLARIARIQRDTSKFKRFKDVCDEYGLRECMEENTPEAIFSSNARGANVLLEGTQGSMLSLLHGYYPYVTSIDTNAAQICAEVGIAPTLLTNVILVVRTYPIRVAGNSGYMKNEITWDAISKTMGRKVEEKTTVTKKVRRIAEWDDDIFVKACILNAPTEIAVTFMDYVDPNVEGVDDVNVLLESEPVANFINHVEEVCPTCTRVKYVGTGGIPNKVVDLW